MNGVAAQRPYHVMAACASCGTERPVYKYRAPKECRRCATKRSQAKAVEFNTGRKRPEMSRDWRGAGNPNWRGGKTHAGKGYIAILLDPVDPMYPMARSDGYAPEHRVVMARAIGRPLYDWEQVHHKNGNRADNRIENLELWKLSQPSGVRQSDYHCPGCRCHGRTE